MTTNPAQGEILEEHKMQKRKISQIKVGKSKEQNKGESKFIHLNNNSDFNALYSPIKRHRISNGI